MQETQAEDIARMKNDRVLLVPEGCEASFLTKDVSENYNENMLKRLQEQIKGKQYWAGRFSVASYNNLDTPQKRRRAESVEKLLVRYLTNLPGAKMINDKKRFQDPCNPIVVISRWQKKMTDDQRYNKPSILRKLPDTLMYVDKEFFAGDKLKLTLYTPD